MWRVLRQLPMYLYHALLNPHPSSRGLIVRQTSINGYRILVFLNEEVGCKIHCHRAFERWESSLVEKLIKEDAICIDVGANIGYYSLLMASKATRGQVHSFEPVSRNLHLMSVSAALNGFTNLVLNCCAVGDVDGFVSFAISEDGAYSSFLDTGRRPVSRSTVVPVARLDSYCRERSIERIDFLKVDVEGAEKRVLEGASGCLQDVHLRPVIMMIELFEPMLRIYGTSIDEVMTCLRDFGYSPFIYLKGRVVPFEKQHYNRYWNVFFARDLAALARTKSE